MYQCCSLLGVRNPNSITDQNIYLMNYKREGTDIFLERKVKNGKKSLQKTFAQNFDTQSKTLDQFIKGINHARFNNFGNTKVIWNIAGFINIISFDLKIVSRDLTISETQWEKRYYIRQASLLIYEAINDIFDLLGKDFKQILIKELDTKDIDDKLIDVRKELNTYKTQYFETLKEIRNNSIAHRDNDIFKQIEIIENLSWSDSIEMVTGFDKILSQLGAVMQKIINQGLKDLNELK